MMSESGKPPRRGKGQTGPKTTAGKRTSARNAFKHGLAAKRPQSRVGGIKAYR
jgi:hypothetical protein